MDYSELQQIYNKSFENVDSLSRKFKLDWKEGVILSESTSQLYQFMELYFDQIDKNELALIEEKIDFYISSLARDSHSNVLNIYYFNKNKSNHYNYLTSTFYSLNLQFKFFKDNLRLDSTMWKYFQRDIVYFPTALKQKFEEVSGPERTSLFFLLLASIESINSSLIAGDQEFQKNMQSIFDQLKTLLNEMLDSEKELGSLIESSPGFLVYLHFFDGVIDGLIINSKIRGRIKDEIKSLNFKKISPKTLAFYLLNQIRIRKGVDKEIECIYEDNEDELENNYPHLNFFISASVRFKDENEKFIGIDIDFDKINENQLKIVIKVLTEKKELKKEHETLEKIGKIIDWGARLENITKWYNAIPIGIRALVFGTILKVMYE